MLNSDYIFFYENVQGEFFLPFADYGMFWFFVFFDSSAGEFPEICPESFIESFLYKDFAFVHEYACYDVIVLNFRAFFCYWAVFDEIEGKAFAEVIYWAE